MNHKGRGGVLLSVFSFEIYIYLYYYFVSRIMVYAFCPTSRGYNIARGVCRKASQWNGFGGRRNIGCIQYITNFTSIPKQLIVAKATKGGSSIRSLTGVTSFCSSVEMSNIGIDRTSRAKSSEIILQEPSGMFLLFEDDDGG